MVELVDSVDLGSTANACRFESCCPHQKREPARALFFGAAGLEPIQSAVLWTAGKRRLDGVYTIVYSSPVARQGSLFWCGRGSNLFNQQSSRKFAGVLNFSE